MSALYIENRVRSINLKQNKIVVTITQQNTFSTKVEVIGQTSMRAFYFASNDEVVSFLDGIEVVLSQII